MVQPCGPALEQRGQGALWLDDVRWHKQMFRQSRFQWDAHDVLRIVTGSTGGQLDFTTVAHLRRLQSSQDQVCDFSAQCQVAMAEPLGRARSRLGWEWTTEVLGLTVVECTMALALAGGTGQEPPNDEVRRVLRQLPLTNPVTQAWELKQLWRLHEAARDVLEDAICDLLVELLAGHPSDELKRATGPLTGSPALRVECARLERGGPGDPRRIPRQRF